MISNTLSVRIKKKIRMYMIVKKDGCVKTYYYILRRRHDSIHYHHPRAKMEAFVCSEEGSVCKGIVRICFLG